MSTSLLQSIYDQLSAYIKVSAASLWLMNEHGFKKRASIGAVINYDDELSFIRDTYISHSIKISDNYLGILLTGSFDLSIIVFIQANKNFTPQVAKIVQDICLNYQHLTQEITYYDNGDDISASSARAIAVTNTLDAIRASEDVFNDQPVLELIANTINDIAKTPNLIIVEYQASCNIVDARLYQDEYDEPRFPFDVEQALVNGSVSAFIVKFGKTLRGNSKDIALDLGVNPGKMYGTHASDLIGVPIKFGDQIFGALIVQNYENGARFDEYVAAMVNSIGKTMGNKLHYEVIKEELKQTIEHRTNDLQEKNQELTNAIKELNRAKEELVKSESQIYIADILWNIVHYLNTPIANAKSNLLVTSNTLSGLIDDIERLNTTVGPSTLQDILNNCYLSEAALNKASDVLTQINKLAIRQTEVSVNRFSLTELCEELREQFSEILMENAIEFELTCGTQRLTGPKELIINILYPLIKNSIDHGHLHVDQLVIKIQIDLRDNVLLIDFRDNGIGIDETMQHNLFKPFSTNNNLTGSLGLGLFTSHYLVTKVLNGTINFDQSFDQGTRFQLQLPIG